MLSPVKSKRNHYNVGEAEKDKRATELESHRLTDSRKEEQNRISRMQAQSTNYETNAPISLAKIYNLPLPFFTEISIFYSIDKWE